MVEEQELITNQPGWMTDQEIDAKHLRLRGSADMKYPPRESSCKKSCGHFDYYKVKGEPAIQHRCFLAIGHTGPCEFSSECVTFECNTK